MLSKVYGEATVWEKQAQSSRGYTGIRAVALWITPRPFHFLHVPIPSCFASSVLPPPCHTHLWPSNASAQKRQAVKTQVKLLWIAVVFYFAICKYIFYFLSEFSDMMSSTELPIFWCLVVAGFCQALLIDFCRLKGCGGRCCYFDMFPKTLRLATHIIRKRRTIWREGTSQGLCGLLQYFVVLFGQQWEQAEKQEEQKKNRKVFLKNKERKKAFCSYEGRKAKLLCYPPKRHILEMEFRKQVHIDNGAFLKWLAKLRFCFHNQKE